MNIESIFHQFTTANSSESGVGLVGAGEFGATFVSQIHRMKGVKVVAICDQQPEKAFQVALHSGIDKSRIFVAQDLESAKNAISQNQCVVLNRADWLAQLPLQAVLEATGDPESAAATALACIKSGKHVVMATKEAEIVVGAELARLAKQHNVVVSPVDGDQPSLLIGLIEWARLLGLPVIAAGKSSESDFVWTPATNEVKAWGQTVVSKEVGQNFIPNDHHSWGDVLANRASVPFDLTTVPDLCEMGIVANHTGLLPDCASLHAPMARTVELPSIFRPKEEGGILSGKGRVDMFNCLRRPDELSFAGGVFVVIEAPDLETGKLFAAKGIPTCPNGKYVLIHNPVHLLGAEAAMSILSAVKLGTSCGGRDVRPVVDLIAIAQRQIEVGELFEIGTRHVISGLGHQLIGAKPMSPDNPLPYYLCAGAKVVRPIPKGKIVSCSDVEIDSNSILYQLRQSQDQHFFPH